MQASQPIGKEALPKPVTPPLAEGQNPGCRERVLQAGDRQQTHHDLAGQGEPLLLGEPPIPACANDAIAFRRGAFVHHPAAKFRRQRAGESPAQSIVIQQHHREPGLAQHQSPALLQEVLAVVGAVGQRLAQRGVQRQGIGQGGIPEGHADIRFEPQLEAGLGLAGDGSATGQLAQHHRPPLLQQAAQHPQRLQRLAVQLPLQHLGIDPGPAGPAVSLGG